MVDLTIKVPAGLSGEDLEDLGASFGATFPELAREAEQSGGLVVVAHPGDSDECPDCGNDPRIAEEVWAPQPVTCTPYYSFSGGPEEAGYDDEEHRVEAWVWVEGLAGWADDWQSGHILSDVRGSEELMIEVGLIELGCDDCDQGERYETCELRYPASDIGRKILFDRNPPPPGPDWVMEAEKRRSRSVSRARTALRILRGRCRICGRRQPREGR